ncbi:hypothetical protein HDV02_000467 [Globomyces sp. JEL0801]|nr:hypothetical protein HDV02_000467 [Globomyces sp. JEL0801]
MSNQNPQISETDQLGSFESKQKPAVQLVTMTVYAVATSSLLDENGSSGNQFDPKAFWITPSKAFKNRMSRKNQEEEREHESIVMKILQDQTYTSEADKNSSSSLSRTITFCDTLTRSTTEEILQQGDSNRLFYDTLTRQQLSQQANDYARILGRELSNDHFSEVYSFEPNSQVKYQVTVNAPKLVDEDEGLWMK